MQNNQKTVFLKLFTSFMLFLLIASISILMIFGFNYNNLYSINTVFALVLIVFLSVLASVLIDKTVLKNYEMEFYTLNNTIRNLNKDLKDNKAELKEYENLVEIAKKAKSQFLSNINHEIRTPMNGVVGIANILLDTNLDSEQREYVNIIIESANRLMLVFNDVIDFSRLNKRQIDVNQRIFYLPEVLDQVVKLYKNNADKKGLVLSSLLYKNVPDYIKGDPERLLQILTKLVDNAIKFSDNGEVMIRAILEEATGVEVKLRFSVSDTGKGISEDDLNILFGEFSQIDGSVTRKHHGTGLGLAISKQISELMGGEMGVESQENKGSTFWFTALFQELSKEETDRLVNEKVESSQLAPLVLVIDKIMLSQRLSVYYLKDYGYRVHALSNLEEAISSLKMINYDVLLIDLKVPFEIISDFIKKIKDPHFKCKNQKIKTIIAITECEEIKMLEQENLKDYVLKPLNSEKINEAVLKCMASER